jgi:hypothetical protein
MKNKTKKLLVRLTSILIILIMILSGFVVIFYS